MNKSLVIGLAGGALIASTVAGVSAHDPFDQRTFPCQEDEVLGFSEEAGPDRVSCIHREAVWDEGFRVQDAAYPSWILGTLPDGRVAYAPGWCRDLDYASPGKLNPFKYTDACLENVWILPGEYQNKL